jgi:Ferritin-like
MRALARLMTVPAEQRDDRWLEEGLQAAIELEMSTIPPYLYAAWSIDGSADPSGCRRVITGIAVEEMRHMGIACNLLASIGGQPQILQAAPTYPTELPKHVHKGLPVGLAPLSRDLLLKTFMAIEEPAAHVVDDPDFVPSGSTLIGQFYDEVQRAFEARSPAFSTTRQIDLGQFFATSSVITSLADVRDGIDLIKRQGEGTAAAPFENSADPDELAHFYQFGEMFHGRRLTRTRPFTYTGDVVQMPTVRMVSPADDTLQESRDFNQAYSDMLRALQRAWEGGDVAAFAGAVGQMFSLGGAAEALIQKGFGPAFIVVDRSGGRVPPPTAGDRFAHVREILDAAVGGRTTFGAHGPFWRGLTRDQFVQHVVFGRPLLVVGNGRESNLVKALRGQLPFGRDTGTAGATFRRMPAGLDPVAPADIDFIEQWINDGCPDAAPVAVEPPVR